VTNLAHKTSVVKDQLEAGMYMLKRVSFFLRKIATSKKTCAAELTKHSEHELEKKERLVKDKMYLHVNAYQQVQHVCTQMAFFEQKFATDLIDKVAEPLLLFHKDLEGRLKRLVASEDKLEAGMLTLRNKIKSERAACIKGWQDLTKEYRDWQKSLAAGDAKKIEKLEKNFLQRREKLRQQFMKFEQLVESANAECKSYWSKELPAIVAAYEVLEVERCNELEARLADFRTIQSEYSQPFPGMLSMVDQAVKGINGPRELQGFVEAVVAQAGLPQAPMAFVDGLPADSRALAEMANQQTLGQLLNQDPVTLASQREQLQLKSSGTVMGSDVVQPTGDYGNLNKTTSPTMSSIGAAAAAAAAPAGSTTPTAAAVASDASSGSGSNSMRSPSLSRGASIISPPPPTMYPSPPAPPPAIPGGVHQQPFVPEPSTYAAAAAAVAASSASAHAQAASSQSAAVTPSSPSLAPLSSPSHSVDQPASFPPHDPFGRLFDPAMTFVRALYDFTSDDPDDLTFSLNTVIRVTLKGEDDELAAEVENGQADLNAEPRWWRGQRLENIGKSRDGTFPSNYVRVCGVERDMSLRHLLELPSGLRVFSDFLAAEYASENIQFWTAVEQFRARCLAFLVQASGAGADHGGDLGDDGRAPMLEEAHRIAREFIGSQAANQVNISSATLKVTQDRIAALPHSLSLNMFDEAASEVMKMLSADSYSRFKRHELFDKYLATDMSSAPQGHGQ